MKTKILFLLLFSIIKIHVIAQHDYIPLAIENTRWLIYVGDGDTFPPFYDHYYGYKIEGDTLINSISYKKVYKRIFTPITIDLNNPVQGPFYISDEYIFGAVRDDIPNKTVYAMGFCATGYSLCECDEEFLLFDFSMEIGDSHPDHCPSYNEYEISSLYEQNIWGADRIVQQTIGSVEVYEGVGHMLGLFEEMYHFAKRPLNVPTLANFCIGTDAECYDGFLLTAQEFVVKKDYFSVYPNPINSFCTISLISDDFFTKDPYIIITDLTNRHIFTQTLTSSTTQIDWSQFESGMYFIHLFMNNQLISSKKTIKL